jgi:hypothetical protein
MIPHSWKDENTWCEITSTSTRILKSRLKTHHLSVTTGTEFFKSILSCLYFQSFRLRWLQFWMWNPVLQDFKVVTENTSFVCNHNFSSLPDIYEMTRPSQFWMWNCLKTLQAWMDDDQTNKLHIWQKQKSRCWSCEKLIRCNMLQS